MRHTLLIATLLVTASSAPVVSASDELFSKVRMDSAGTSSASPETSRSTPAAKEVRPSVDVTVVKERRELLREAEIQSDAKEDEPQPRATSAATAAAAAAAAPGTGKWSASVATGEAIAIRFEPNGRFALVHLKNGTLTKSFGKIEQEGNQVLLVGDDGIELTTRLTWQRANHFQLEILNSGGESVLRLDFFRRS